ncbi:PAS domain S-box-containing protein/diguanylate cyclase (GGDEF) domain-containing protein [Nitrosomonas sp. Nm51]|uniref:EAL domain-containing protein n=1 Tax=Nitrosomonas sp. Nm51 TaxID=133720 RepID=UPI0008CE892A|nr:EAL domain-containing protein [Nitrosomonas sp. Nm51]SER53142.1 PAS domain S-box-containing protein/diguanylate cyclase (GGDEF) domain-containing protein [Nitrosomonas sp. Nm51]
MKENISEFSDINCRKIFDTSLDAIFIVDTKGKILFANRTAVKRYGYSLKEIKKMNISELAAQEMKSQQPIKFNKPPRSKEIYEWKHRCKDGSELPVEIHTHSIIHNKKRIFFLSVRDTSMRKDFVPELQSRNQMLERILNTEPGMVYIFDLLERENVYINKQWVATFGYTAEKTQTKKRKLTRIIHPEDRSVIAESQDAWRNAYEGETRSIEYRVSSRQGDWHWLVSYETPFTCNEEEHVCQILGIAYDITQRKHAEILLGGQNRILEMIATGTPVSETLTALIRIVEDLAPGMMGSILLLDDDGIHLRHGAAPNLPDEYNVAVESLSIGPVAGSCGTAAFRKEAVFVENIATDPLWAPYKSIALSHGLRACWSIPIFDVNKEVIGTFAMYYRKPGLPEAEHLRLIDVVTHIAAIAINCDKTDNVLRRSEARYRSLFEYAPDGIVVVDNQDYCLDVNASACRMLGYNRDELTGLCITNFIKQIKTGHPGSAFKAIKAKMNNQQEWQFERKDGSHFTAEMMAATMPDNNLLCMFRDITEQKDTEFRLKQLAQLYAALSQCNQAIVRCTNTVELLPQICRDAVNFGGMKMVWIGMIDEADKLIRPVASFGTGIACLQEFEFPIDTAFSNSGYDIPVAAIREKKAIWCQDIMNDAMTVTLRTHAIEYGWGAAASLPLYCKGEVVGVFNLFRGDTFSFDEAVQKLIIEMAADISFALNNFAIEKERAQSVEALRLSEQYLRTIIETEPECVKVVGKNGKILEMNAAGLAMLEVDSLEIVKQHDLADFILPEYRDAFKALHQHVMNGGHKTLEFEIRGLKGTKRWLETHAAPMRDEHGHVVTLLGITRDVSERKRNEARIKYLANFDALTGLPNRTQLDNHLNYALNLAKRSNGRLALMFVDIDRFKDINDTLGHSVGDAFLIEASRRLKLALRTEDTISRLGGDEFILLLPGNEARGAAQVAQKILRVISDPFRNEHFDLIVTASIGIALYPDDGSDIETLSKNADIAMYRAKREGRDGYRFFTSEMQAQATRNLQLVNALRHALEKEQFMIYYQPQVSLRTGHIIGGEALLRWRHPALGNVAPDEFIPVAEDSGVILQIGEWVLRTAVRQLKDWINRGHSPITIAVNLSAVQFRHASLLDMIIRLLNGEAVAPEYLELELTEGVAMHDPLGAISVMSNLHELGIRMSIDDFGTGYSSLSYLKKFKVYKLKIDRSFVRDITTDQEDRAIVAAIISMSKSLGLKTIAEGVETNEQLSFLREQGCGEAQGYYYSKPVPADQFERLLTNNKT